jgi:RNA polymerase sigma factor (sigma-70 family)
VRSTRHFTEPVTAQPPLDCQPDAALLLRFAKLRDEVAFAELMRRHGPLVLAVCLRLLRQRQDAEDAFQAVFLALANRARALRRVRSLAGWLHNVAFRVSCNLRRANRRRHERMQALRERRQDSTANPLIEFQDVLDEELTALPARYREAIVLCDLQGHTREEAARRLDVPVGTVGTWLSRGRSRLKERLQRRGVSFGVGGVAATLAPLAEASPAPSAELVSETLHNAKLFVAGTGEGGVPVATTITSLAQGVLNTMFLTRLSTTVCILALAAALVLGATPVSRMLGITSNLRAGEYFLDTFDDDNLYDGNPVTCRKEGPPFDQGIIEAVNGNMVLTPPQTMPPLTYVEMDAAVDGLEFGDVSLRTQVRARQAGAFEIAVFGRSTFLPSNGLVGTSVIGAIRSAGQLLIRATNFNGGQGGVDLATLATQLNAAAYDVNLQLDIIGDTAMLTAWRNGMPMPSVPQLTVDSLPNYIANEGLVGLYNAQLQTQQPKIPVEFRYFEAVPEPSTVALGSLGIVAVAGLVFRTRLNRVQLAR